MITKDELERSKELAGKATPGPWMAFENGSWGGQGFGIQIGEDIEEFFTCPDFLEYRGGKHFNKNGGKNALHIAHHNPEFILKMHEIIEHYQATIEEYKRIVFGVQHECSICFYTYNRHWADWLEKQMGEK